MSKFKVGEKVVVVKQTNGWGRVNPGDEGVVRTAQGGMYIVDFPKHPFWNGLEECFEHININLENE